MTEQKSNSLTLILGIAIGALIIYLFLKNKTITSSPQIQLTNSLSIENRLDTIEQNLRQLQQIQLQHLNQTSQPIQQTPSTQSQQTTYNNSEKTNFILNKDGDIIGMETIRNAKIG